MAHDTVTPNGSGIRTMKECVGRVAELPPGSMAEVSAFGRVYLLCNVEGQFFATQATCPHRGAPLAYGALHHYTIVCPWHCWEFDCRTGKGDCADIVTARVTIEDERIHLHAGTS
jgi:nitrite reductase/ring-hydroxylating ferredoxin subunit